jgi:hypothetical protein
MKNPRGFLLIIIILLLPAVPARPDGSNLDRLLGWLFPSDESSQALDAPQFIQPEDLSYFVTTDTILIEWTEVQDATGYLLEIKAPFVLDISEVITGTTYELTPEVLEPETFICHVRALGPSGESNRTGPLRIIVLEEAFTPTPTPTATPTRKIDLTGEGQIGSEDTFLLLSRWQQNAPSYDFSGDGFITHEDVLHYRSGYRRRNLPTPTPLLPPPQLLQPADGAFIDRDEIILVKQKDSAETRQLPDNGVWFRWQSIERADGYDLRIEGPDQGTLGTQVISSGTPGVKITLEITTQSNDLGVYHWQVRSTSSALEQAGPYSTPFSFELVKFTSTPTPTPTVFPQAGGGDVNQDGRISAGDIFRMTRAWLKSGGELGSYPNTDLDASGRVDAEDFLIFIENYNRRDSGNIEAPALLAPSNGATVYLDQLAPGGGFQWSFAASEGAVVYQYEVQQPPPFGKFSQLLEDDGSDAYSLPISPRSVGQWSWRVRAFRQSGRVSLWSPLYSFDVKPSLTPRP